MMVLNKIVIFIVFMATSIFAKDIQLHIEDEEHKLDAKVFKHYDKDKNSVLSLEEYSLFAKDKKQKMFKNVASEVMTVCDKNNDNFIALDELVPESKWDLSRGNHKQCFLREDEFKSMDKNKDNLLSSQEYLSFFESADSKYKGMFSSHKEEIQKEELDGFKETLTLCDKNKDGQLTLVEFTSNQCHMSSDMFLNYSTSYQKSFEIAKVTKLPSRPSVGRGEDKLDINAMDGLPKEAQIGILFSMCDTNKDMRLIVEEAQNCKLNMEIFDTFDYDKSASIDKNDIAMISKIEEFNRVDLNQNKKIDLEEFSKSQRRGF